MKIKRKNHLGNIMCVEVESVVITYLLLVKTKTYLRKKKRKKLTMIAFLASV